MTTPSAAGHPGTSFQSKQPVCIGEFRSRCEQTGIQCWTGRAGNCYDNAIAESFCSTLELELLDLRPFETRQQAGAAVGFIDGFYNTARLHPALGCRSPIAFENEFESLLSQTH